MCPLYEYSCQGCGNSFDRIVSFDNRDSVSCPDCGAKPDRKMSVFSFKFYNPFTKDGEGFSSVTYPRDEYKRRVATNALKDDVYHRDFE